VKKIWPTATIKSLISSHVTFFVQYPHHQATKIFNKQQPAKEPTHSTTTCETVPTKIRFCPMSRTRLEISNHQQSNLGRCLSKIWTCVAKKLAMLCVCVCVCMLTVRLVDKLVVLHEASRGPNQDTRVLICRRFPKRFSPDSRLLRNIT
jgi:hypothetical protein